MINTAKEIFQNGSEKTGPETFHIALLAAYAIGLHSIERFIPAPIPWLRFGFANIITLTTLLLYGFRAGMTVTLIRVLVGSLLTGTFLGPGFVLSLSGGVVSTLAMWTAKTLTGNLFGPVGLSLLGSFFHNVAQLIVAYAFFVKKFEAILYITPIIILIGVGTGAVNGVVTGLILKRVRGSTLVSSSAL